MPRSRYPPRWRWRADLAVVVAATLASYAISVALELNEWMTERLARYEHWQADEVPLTLTVLAAGMAWYIDDYAARVVVAGLLLGALLPGNPDLFLDQCVVAERRP